MAVTGLPQSRRLAPAVAAPRVAQGRANGVTYGDGQWVAVGQESSGNNILLTADPRTEWNHSPILPFGIGGSGYGIAYGSYMRGNFSVNMYLLYIGLAWIYTDMMNSTDSARRNYGIHRLLLLIPQLLDPATNQPALQDASADYLQLTATITAPANATQTIYGFPFFDISGYNIYLNDQFLFQQSPRTLNLFTGAVTTASVTCNIYNLLPDTAYTLAVSATNILGIETAKTTLALRTASVPSWWSRVNPTSIAFFRATLPIPKDEYLFNQLLSGLQSFNAPLVEKMKLRNFIGYLLYNIVHSLQLKAYYTCQLLFAYIDLYMAPDSASNGAGMVGLLSYMPLLMDMTAAIPSAPIHLIQGDTSFFNTTIHWTPPPDAVTATFYELQIPMAVANTIYRNSARVAQQLLGPSSSSFTDLSANTSYQFEVTALNRLGEESSRSLPLAVRTPVLPSWWSAYGTRPALLQLLRSFTKSQPYLAPAIADQRSTDAAIYRQTTILLTPGQECIDSNELNPELLQWLCFDLLTSPVQAEAEEASVWLIKNLPFIPSLSATRFDEIGPIVMSLLYSLPVNLQYMPNITSFDDYQTYFNTYTPATTTDFINVAYFQWYYAKIDPFIATTITWLFFYLPHINLIQPSQRSNLLAFLQTQPGAHDYTAPFADQSGAAAKNWRFQNIYYKSSIPACLNSVWHQFDQLSAGPGTQPFNTAVDALTLSLPPLLTIIPTPPFLSKVEVIYLSASIQWEVPILMVTGYNVYIDSVLVSGAQTATAYEVHDLAANHSYHMEVAGILPSGQETPRATCRITTTIPSWWNADRTNLLATLQVLPQSQIYLDPNVLDQGSADAALWRSEHFPTTIAQDCINYYTAVGDITILQWLYFDLMLRSDTVEQAELWLIQHLSPIPGLDLTNNAEIIPLLHSFPATPLGNFERLLENADYESLISKNNFPLTSFTAYIIFARFLYNSSYIYTYEPLRNWLKQYVPLIAALQNRATLLSLLPSPNSYQAPFADQTSVEAATWRFQHLYMVNARSARLHTVWNAYDQMGSTDPILYNRGAQTLIDYLLTLINVIVAAPTIIEVQSLYLSVMVDWEASSPRGYNVYLNDIRVSAHQVETKYTNYDLSANTIYKIDITAISAFGNESEKASVTIRETRNVPRWWHATIPTVYSILSQLSDAARYLYNPQGYVPASAPLVPNLSLSLNSITVTGPATIAPGSTGQLTLTFDPPDSFFANLNYVIFISSDTTIATVSGTGLVTAISNGTVTITAQGGMANSVTTPFQIVCGLTLDQLQATSAAINYRLENIYNADSLGTTLRDAAAYYEHQLNTTVNYTNYVKLAWLYADMIQSTDIAIYNQGVGGLILRLPIARAVRGLIDFNDGGISDGFDYLPANMIYEQDAADGSIILPAPAIIKHSTRFTHIEAGAFGGLRYLSFAGGPVYKVANGNIIQAPLRDVYYVTANGVDILLPSMPAHSSTTIYMPRNVANIPRNYFAASPAAAVSFPIWNDREELLINYNALPRNIPILVGSDRSISYSPNSTPVMTYTADLSNSIVLVYSGVFYINDNSGSTVLWVPTKLRENNGTTLTFPLQLVALPQYFSAEPCTTYMITNENDPWTPGPRVDARIARNWDSADTRTATLHFGGFIYKVKYPGQVALGTTSFPIIGQTQTTFPSRVSFLNYPSGIQQPIPAIIKNPGALVSNTLVIPTYMSFTNADMPDGALYYYGNLKWQNSSVPGQSRIVDFNPQSFQAFTLMAGTSPLYANMFANLDVYFNESFGSISHFPLTRFINNITIVGEITVIPAFTFYDCYQLNNQPFNTITSVGEYAFRSCRIPSLSLTQSVPLTIANHAFQSCNMMQSINVRTTSNLSIGDYAFTECNHVTTLTLNCGGTLSLTPTALAGCNPITLSVTNIPIHGSQIVQDLLTTLFTAIDSYTNLHFLTLILSTSLSLGSASRYQNITSVTILCPSVTLTANQFVGCQSLEDVTIHTITALPGGDLFAGCSNLRNVNMQFSSDVSGAFSTLLGGEIIGQSVGWLSVNNLVSLSVTGGCIALPESFLYGTAPILTSLTLHGISSSFNTKFLTSDNLFSIANGYPSLQVLDLQFAGPGAILSSPLANLPALQTISIGGAVTVSSPNFLANSASALKSLSLSANFTGQWDAGTPFQVVESVYVNSDKYSSIQPYQFINNKKLKSIYYTKTKKIGTGAFFGCTQLQDLSGILLEGLLEIGDLAFVNSGAAGVITLPSTLISFGLGYFGGCNSITTLRYLCDVVMFVDPTRIGKDVWNKINNIDRQIYRLTGDITCTGGFDATKATLPYFTVNTYEGGVPYMLYHQSDPLFFQSEQTAIANINTAIDDMLTYLHTAYNTVVTIQQRITPKLTPVLLDLDAIIQFVKNIGEAFLGEFGPTPDLAVISGFGETGWSLSYDTVYFLRGGPNSFLNGGTLPPDESYTAVSLYDVIDAANIGISGANSIYLAKIQSIPKFGTSSPGYNTVAIRENDIYIDVSSTSIIKIEGERNIFQMDGNKIYVVWKSPVKIIMTDNTEINISGSVWFDITRNMGIRATICLSWIHANSASLIQGNSVNFAFSNTSTLIQYLDYKTGGTVDISSNIVMIYPHAMEKWNHSTLTISADRVKLYNNAFNQWSICQFNLTIADIVGAGVYPGLDLFYASDQVTINSNRLLINHPNVQLIDMTGWTLADVPEIILSYTQINPQQTTNVSFTTYIPPKSSIFTQGIPMIKFQSTETLQEFVLIAKPNDWFWCFRSQPYSGGIPPYNPGASIYDIYGGQGPPGSTPQAPPQGPAPPRQPGIGDFYFGKETLPAPPAGLDHGAVSVPMIMNFITNDPRDPIGKATGLSGSAAPNEFSYQGTLFEKISISNVLVRAVKTQDLTGQGARNLLTAIGWKDPTLTPGPSIFNILTGLVPPQINAWTQLTLNSIPGANAFLQGLEDFTLSFVQGAADLVNTLLPNNTVVRGILVAIAVVASVLVFIAYPEIIFANGGYGRTPLARLRARAHAIKSRNLNRNLGFREKARQDSKNGISHLQRDPDPIEIEPGPGGGGGGPYPPGPEPTLPPTDPVPGPIITEPTPIPAPIRPDPLPGPIHGDDIIELIGPVPDPVPGLLPIFERKTLATARNIFGSSDRKMTFGIKNIRRDINGPKRTATHSTDVKSVISDIKPEPKIGPPDETLDIGINFKKIDLKQPKPPGPGPGPGPGPDADPIPKPFDPPKVNPPRIPDAPPVDTPDPLTLLPTTQNVNSFGEFTTVGTVMEKKAQIESQLYWQKLKSLHIERQAGSGIGPRAATLTLKQIYDIQSYVFDCMYRTMINDCTSAYDGSVLLWHYQNNQTFLKNVTRYTLEQIATYKAITSQPNVSLLEYTGERVLIDSSLPSAYYLAATAMIPPYIAQQSQKTIPNTEPWMFFDVMMKSTQYNHLILARGNTGYPCAVQSIANPLNQITSHLWHDTYLGPPRAPQDAEINICGLGLLGSIGPGLIQPHTTTSAPYRYNGVKLCVQTSLTPVELNYQSEIYLGSRQVNYSVLQREAPNRVYSGAENLTILIPSSITEIPTFAFCNTDCTDGIAPFSIRNLYINPSVSQIAAQAFYRSEVQNIYLNGTVGAQSFANSAFLRSVIYFGPVVTYVVNTTLTINVGPNPTIIFKDNRIIISNFTSATGDNGQQIPGSVLSAVINVTYDVNGLPLYLPPTINNTTQGTVTIYPRPYQTAEYYSYIQNGNIFFGNGALTGVKTSFTITSLSQIIIPRPGTVTTESGFTISSSTALLSPAANSTNTIAVGDKAFSGNISLTKVKFPMNCTHIGNRAFADTTSLKTIVIPNSVLSLGDEVFAGSGLHQITIPPTLQTIGNNIFQGITELTIVMASPPPVFKELMAQVPDGTVFYTPTQAHVDKIRPMIAIGVRIYMDTSPNPPLDFTGIAYANRIYLTWNPPIPSNGSAIDHYTLQFDESRPSLQSIYRSVQQVTSPYILGGLKNRIAYTVSLLAVNSTGQSSEPTTLTITPVPDPPALFTYATAGYSLFSFDLEEGESLVTLTYETNTETETTLERLYIAGGPNILTSPLTLGSGTCALPPLAQGCTYLLINGPTELALQTYEGRDIPLTLVKQGSTLLANGCISSADTGLQVFTIDGQPVTHGDVLTFRNKINLPIEVIANDPDAITTITGSELQEDGVHIVVVAVLAANGATIASYSVTVNLFVNTISFATVESLQSPISISRVINSFLTDSDAIPAAVLLPRFLTEMDACKVPVPTQIELLVALLQQRLDLTAAINEALRSRGIRPNKSYPVSGFSILIPTSTTIDIDMKSPRLLLALVAGQQYKVRAHYKGKFSKTVFSGVKARMEFVFQRDIMRTFELEGEGEGEGAVIGVTGFYFIPPPSGTTIRLFPDVGEITVGSSVRLAIIVRPSPILLNWSSSSSCVRVANGVITGVTQGQAIITAASLDGSVSASSRVTVQPQ